MTPVDYMTHLILGAAMAVVLLAAAPVMLPKKIRVVLAHELLGREELHIFNAHVRENDDGSITVYGPAQK